MTLSALAMGVAGVILSFLPHEISGYLHLTAGTIVDVLILQILGALYFGFAMLNWTARANLIGGIYSRPVAIGNLAHFIIGALALLKGYSSSFELIVLIMAMVYSGFAISFVMIFFIHPVKDKN